MGVSIILYRVPKSEKIDDLIDIDNQIALGKHTSVNLYKITGDLAVIFLNTIEPYDDPDTLPYKMLYGILEYKSVSVGEVGGFLPYSEVQEIVEWIRKNEIETLDGFSKIYDDLSEEVKLELNAIGTDDKIPLFKGYVKPLTDFYFAALESESSILFVGQ